MGMDGILSREKGLATKTTPFCPTYASKPETESLISFKIGSLSNSVMEQRTSTGSGLFSFLGTVLLPYCLGKLSVYE